MDVGVMTKEEIDKIEIGDYVQIGSDSYKVTGGSCSSNGNVLHCFMNLKTNDARLLHAWELESAFSIIKYPIELYDTFDKVMVRWGNSHAWKITLFEQFVVHGESVIYNTMCGDYPQCVLYNEDTKELLGTKDEAPEFYKTWKD